MPDGAEPVLDVKGLRTVFRTRSGEVHAVNDVSFSVAPGELLGVVGESGSGKSVTMMSLIGLLPSPPAEVLGGRVMFEGQDLLKVDGETLRRVRGGKIGFVFQDPMTSLNPVFTVGSQIMEPLRVHMGMDRRAARARARDLLEMVGIPDADRRLEDYPHQFSGGMRQRVMIAIALACEPRLLIADEPTTALDVIIQAQILELMGELRQRLGMAVIWITHDLGVIAGIADRVMVMYGGQVVEEAAVETLFGDPRAPLYQSAAWHGAEPAWRADAAAERDRGTAPSPGGCAGCLHVPRPLPGGIRGLREGESAALPGGAGAWRSLPAGRPRDRGASDRCGDGACLGRWSRCATCGCISRSVQGCCGGRQGL